MCFCLPHCDTLRLSVIMRQNKPSLPSVVSVRYSDCWDARVTWITGTRSGVASVTVPDCVVIRPVELVCVRNVEEDFVNTSERSSRILWEEVSGCLSFLSVTVIKFSDKSKLRANILFLAFVLILWQICKCLQCVLIYWPPNFFLPIFSSPTTHGPLTFTCSKSPTNASAIWQGPHPEKITSLKINSPAPEAISYK